ncbi:MAG: UbiA family prenyltransferase [Pseudomonadota bacterium]
MKDLEKSVLVVDLDGTLLKSDMLLETFWSATGRDFFVPFRAVSVARKGRPVLKKFLLEKSDIDVSTLPYDGAVIAFVQRHRENGGRTALVTASNEILAQQIGDHLGIFDEVHGSDGETNLKSENKAAFLESRFGADQFAYMGDAAADLPVWKKSNKVITVNAPAALQTKAQMLGKPVEHLTTISQSYLPYVRALRPHQWLKNVLIFLPMLAAHQMTGATLLQSLIAFISFSLIASSVYVVNDLLDLKSDRVHPRKCKRPLAAGDIPILNGSILAGGLVTLGALVAALLGGPFFVVMLAYYLITTAYSLYLKKRIVIDICVLASLYTVRIVAGGAATGIPLSVWLLAFSMFFFFSLAAVKRQAELVDLTKQKQESASGRGYRVEDLPIMSNAALSSGLVSVLVMALYVNSPDVTTLYSQPTFLWGVCAVLLYWLTRMVLMTHRGEMHDDPVVFAAKDRVSQICILVIFAFALVGAAI